MALVVLGIDALDPDLVDPEAHPNLALADWHAIDTIVSHTGEPSTHELWPTVITGLEPEEHGLQLEDGVAWGNPLLEAGSDLADVVLPDGLQSRIGAWLLTNTDTDAFRTPATYYEEEGIETVFDGREATAIGVPNYVVDPDAEDREHQLRRRLGDLFERDPEVTGGHRSSDPETFYEQCMEMAMVRVARARRAVRGERYELAFAYTSGLDLIGHVAYDRPSLQRAAYCELDEFVGELRTDLRERDELLLVSDHGLQDGVHTDEAMVAASDPSLIAGIKGVTDVSEAIERELSENDHSPSPREFGDAAAATDPTGKDGERVKDQLEDLGYM